MKVSNRDEVRISILLALAVGEVVGVLHFIGQPRFSDFVFQSLVGILLAIPLLWIECIQRRGISYFDVVFSVWICAMMTSEWKAGNLFVRFIIAGLPIVVAIRILRKLRRSKDRDQQEILFTAIRAEDIRFGRVSGNAIGLITCILLLAFMGPGRASLLWAIPLVIPAAWFAWRLILHLFIRRETGDEADAPIESATAHGGRA